MTDETRHSPETVSHAKHRRVRITSSSARVYEVTFDGNGDVVNVMAVVKDGRHGEHTRLNWGDRSGRPMSELTKAITRIAAQQLTAYQRPEGK